MANNDARREIHDILRDIGHEITNTLEFSANAVGQESVLHGGDIALDPFSDFLEEFSVEVVDDFVARDEQSGGIDVFIENGAEEIVAHGRDAVAHVSKGGGPRNV